MAPANHHDSHFLSPLVRLGKAIGLDLKLITADEAYHDTDGSFFKESGVHLVKPSNSKVSLPANVDRDTLQVKKSTWCSSPKHFYYNGYFIVNLDSLANPAACEALPNGRTYGECARCFGSKIIFYDKTKDGIKVELDF